MTYLDALDSELKRAGIPARRRARIIAEFADHLQQNPEAELGAPRDLARQFADELGTRLARDTAFRAFVVLALAGIVLLAMFFEGGRTWGAWVGYGRHPASGYIPGWWLPLMLVWFVAAQVALASGSLALLRAWRLRHESVITADDAAIINRRAALALVTGAFTMLVLPVTDLMLSRPLNYRPPGAGPDLIANHWRSLFALNPSWWGYGSIIAGPLLIIAMLALLPSVLAAARLRPGREGKAGDLTTDLAVHDERVTPLRIALALSAVIVLLMLAVGVGSDDPIDGFARGLVDAAACMAGFAVLGGYLGLRATV